MLTEELGWSSCSFVCDPTGPQGDSVELLRTQKSQGALLWFSALEIGRLPSSPHSFLTLPLHSVLKGKEISLVVVVAIRNIGLLGSLFFPGTEYCDYSHSHH